MAERILVPTPQARDEPAALAELPASSPPVPRVWHLEDLTGAIQTLIQASPGRGQPLPAVNSLPPVVEGSKSSPSYLAHTYHTKVPPEVVEAAVRRFSLPGEVVLDPFSGSGMTGVGALAAGRRAILVDLSPSAAFLSRAHGAPVDLADFERALRRVTSQVWEEAAYLYGASCSSCGLAATLEKTIWTEVVVCPACGAAVHIYQAALGEDQRIHQTFTCGVCHHRLKRGEGRRLRWEMAVVETRCGGCGRRRGQPQAADLKLVRTIERRGLPSSRWHPADRIAWGDMWRRGYHEGVEHYADFYTTRNLRMLGAIFEAVIREPDPDIRRGLLFVFTNLVWHGSKMRRFNALGGARPMNGALYLPAVFEETNLLTLWRHKARMVARHYASIAGFDRSALIVGVGSATDLSPIPSESVDFVFTDPPYGGNILYSEVNALWEA